MFEMLIVDDNNRDRRILQQILRWEDYGIRVAGAAADGMEALELARAHAPDILITDISMPRLNGIELAREIGKLSPATQIVFISCYSDFEYAKQAVNLNVFGYINKPLNQEELAELAGRVAESCRDRASREQKYAAMLRQIQAALPVAREEFLRELLLGQSVGAEQLADNARFLELPADRARRFQVAVLRFSEKADAAEEQYYLNYDLKQWTARQCTEAGDVFLVRVSPVEYAAVLFSYHTTAREAEDRALEMVSGLYGYCADHYPLDCTVGVSNPAEGLGAVPELYRQAVWAMRSKFYTLGMPLLLYRDIGEGRESEPPTLSEREWNDELRDIVDGGDKAEAERFVDRYFGAVGRRFPETFYKQRAFSLVGQLHFLLSEQSLSFSELCGGDSVFERLSGFATIYELNGWLKGLLAAAMDRVHGENASRDEKLVASIKKIIHTRYGEQLTAESIAESVYLSTKQANNIFRRETGKTIFDYLVEHRIETAKRLLRDPSNRIYWVAEQVGYQNKSYFALVFKKMTGLTPIDYRNQPG